MSFQDGIAAGPPYPQSPDPTLGDPTWLEHLDKHSIFTPPAEHVMTTSAQSATNPRLMAVRNTDFILVAGNKIRMASLQDAKSSLASRPMSPSPSSSSFHSKYKVITPSDESHLDFEINNIVVNPTGKLLAVVGEQRIALIVLPRSGYNKHVGTNISARSAPIGAYYHSSHGFTNIAKVQWHPWGEAGTSLLVLTDDGLLREYDVSRDTEEPQQTISFLPRVQGSSAGRSRSRSATPTAASLAASMQASPGLSLRDSPSTSRQGTPSAGYGLSAEDDESRIAVSFALCVTHSPSNQPTVYDQADDQAWATSARHSRGADDWSAFTLFGLMKNGDIWAVCPFMPRNSMIPPSYVHSLSRLTSLKLSSASYEEEDTEAQFESEMQLRFLNSLLKQVTDKQDRSERQGSRSRSTVSPGVDRYSRQRSTSTMDLDRLSEAPGAQEDEAVLEDLQDVPLRLHPPSWAFAEGESTSSSKNAPRPQGPFLLRPPPVELCDERESSACDMTYTWLEKKAFSPTTGDISGIGVLAIVGHDGRVDIGILLESVEARWGKPEKKGLAKRLRSVKTPSRSNRYGLSDTEDETDDRYSEALPVPASDLPTLLIYETIDLGLLDSIMDSSSSSQAESSDFLLDQSASYRPCLVLDPLYRDTIYVYHALGAQCLSLAKWASKLIDVLNMPSEDDLDATDRGQEKVLTKLLHHGEATEVVWIVKTVTSGEGSAISINPIVGVCVLSDVYLSYSLLVVTRDLQLVALELSLRIATEELDSTDLNDTGVRADSNGRKAYVSLLGDGPPFNPPSLFNQNGSLQGLPTQPRRAAANGSSPSSVEIKVTPDTLRQLGKTVETFRGEIRDVVQAGNAVQARLDLQVREMTRMLEKLEAIRKRSEKLLGALGLEARLKRVTEKQNELTARTDKALQRLMDRHQPSLSVYEKKWFDELARIAGEIGVGETKRGLAAKAGQLEHHLSLLRPALEEKKQSKPSKLSNDAFTSTASSPVSKGMGKEQLKRVEGLLSNEAGLLSEAKDKVTELNARIARMGGGQVDGGGSLLGRSSRGSSVF